MMRLLDPYTAKILSDARLEILRGGRRIPVRRRPPRSN